MDYRLKVIRIEPNPKAGEYIPRRGYGGIPEIEPLTIETASLDIVLSEDEWAAVKKACLETFK